MIICYIFPQNDKFDGESKKEAFALLKAVTCFDYIIGVITLYHIMHRLKGIKQKLLSCKTRFLVFGCLFCNINLLLDVFFLHQFIVFVKIQFAYWKSVSPCRTPPTMGCVRSKIEPLICESDEPKFLANWSHCKADNRIITSQSSSDISLVKIGRKENSNMAPGSCPSDPW